MIPMITGTNSAGSFLENADQNVVKIVSALETMNSSAVLPQLRGMDFLNTFVRNIEGTEGHTEGFAEYNVYASDDGSYADANTWQESYKKWKNDTPVDFQQSIEAIRKQYEDLAKKQKQEYENEVAKIQLQLEKQKQKEVMAGMTETEKERYALNLKIKELQETINVFETRNKDLEARLEKQNNEKYISDRIQEYPYIKDFVNKLNVQTKAEYESKILPILGQIKDLQDLKSQNQMYGNKNAFAGYGNQGLKEDSDVRKKIDSYSQDFIKGLIKK